MRAGEDREPDRVDVFLDGGRDDLLRCLVQPGVDDLHAGVAQRAGHDLGPAVVTVEPDLRDDHPDLAHADKPNRNVQACDAQAGPLGQGPVAQSTQGMPFFAETAPPCAPVVGSETAELEAVGVAPAPGTVAFAPSMTWT